MPSPPQPDYPMDVSTGRRRRGRCPSPGVRARPGIRIRRWSGWLALLVLLWAPAMPAADVPRSEYEVKAAWLLNFVRFTEWPATAFSGTNSPHVIGVLGRDPFGKDLERTLEGKFAKGRPFVIKRLADDREVLHCHVLFIPQSERRRLRDLRDKLKNAAVLTVVETEDPQDYSGVINIRLRNESIKLSIDLTAAQAARLKLDANLVGLAEFVRGKYE